MASGVTKSNMEAWMNLTHPDVRTKKKVKDALRQTSLLEYTCQSGTTYGRHSGPNAGRFERERIMTLVVGTVEVDLPVFMRRNWAPVSLQLAEADTTQSAVART